MSDYLPPDDDPTIRRPATDPRDLPRRPTVQRIPTLPPEDDYDPEPEPPRRPPRKRRGRRGRDGGSLLIPWWGFVIVILGVAALTCGMWWLVLANRGTADEALPSPTPIFVVITSSPTLGAPGAVDTNAAGTTIAMTPTATEAALPTETPTLEAVANPVAVGSQVVIDGTEGDGLAVRQGPGVDFTFFFVADDGDQFLVQDGPASADGYQWWYIVDPADEDRAGWAVEDFMVVTPGL
jgi:hypothetical protein